MKNILFIILTTILNATGNPYINIKLTPIATNYSGEVLFQTYSNINTHGSYSCTYDKFGWLVVSANGVWDERVAYDTSEIFDNNCNYKDKKKYEAYKSGKISLKNPDKILNELQEKYYFNHSIAESNEKYKVVALKPKQSCFFGKCIDKVLPQKSIEGFVSKELIKSKAQSLRSSFYYKGVALMRTPLYVDEETVLYNKHQNDNPKSYEQKFNLPLLPKGRSYDATFIDSIVFVEPFDFRQPTKAVKSEVEKAVREIVQLLKEKSVKSIERLNSKYIHPRHGLYLVYRMGACDSIEHYKKIDFKNLPSLQNSVVPSEILFYFYIEDKAFTLPPIQWKEVSYDCRTEAWSNIGTFIHDNGYDAPSMLCDFSSYSLKERTKIKFLTTNTVTVNITEHDITFELKKIDGHWYIVIINGVETDCSA